MRPCKSWDGPPPPPNRHRFCSKTNGAQSAQLSGPTIASTSPAKAKVRCLRFHVFAFDEIFRTFVVHALAQAVRVLLAWLGEADCRHSRPFAIAGDGIEHGARDELRQGRKPVCGGEDVEKTGEHLQSKRRFSRAGLCCSGTAHSRV